MAVWEGIVDRLKGRRTLDKVALDEIRHERINLDQKEREFIQQIQKLEREQKELLDAGIKEPSQHMKMVYAGKVTEKDAEIRMNEKVLQSLRHQARIVNGLNMVKKWSQITSQDKSRLLNRLSLAEVTKWIHDKTVDGEFKDEYFEELGGALERGVGVLTEIGAGEDVNTKRVFELMVKAGTEGAPVEKVQEEVKSTLRSAE